MNFNKFYKLWKKLYNELFVIYEHNQRFLNNLVKTSCIINNIERVNSVASDNNISIRQAIIQLNLQKQKSTLYEWILKIESLEEKNISNIIIQNTGPKTIKYKYDEHIRKLIADSYYVHFFNRTNIWLNFRKLFPEIALKTICKIINNDDRNPKKNKRAKIKHPLRYYNLPFGCIQMDLKIIGPKKVLLVNKLPYMMQKMNNQSFTIWKS